MQVQAAETDSEPLATDSLPAVVERVALEDPDELGELLDKCAAGTTIDNIADFSSIECPELCTANELLALEEWQRQSALSTSPSHLQPQSQAQMQQQQLVAMFEPISSPHSISFELETQESAGGEAMFGLVPAALTSRGIASATSTRHPTPAQITNIDTNNRGT